MIPRHRQQYGITRAKFGKLLPKPVQNLLLHFSELLGFALLDQITGKQHRLPRAAEDMQFSQIIEKRLAQIRPKEILTLKAKMKICQV